MVREVIHIPPRRLVYSSRIVCTTNGHLVVEVVLSPRDEENPKPVSRMSHYVLYLPFLSFCNTNPVNIDKPKTRNVINTLSTYSV